MPEGRRGQELEPKRKPDQEPGQMGTKEQRERKKEEEEEVGRKPVAAENKLVVLVEQGQERTMAVRGAREQERKTAVLDTRVLQERTTAVLGAREQGRTKIGLDKRVLQERTTAVLDMRELQERTRAVRDDGDVPAGWEEERRKRVAEDKPAEERKKMARAHRQVAEERTERRKRVVGRKAVEEHRPAAGKPE